MNIEKKVHDILYDAIISTKNYSEWIEKLKNNSDNCGASRLTKNLIEEYEKVPQGLKWHPEFELSKHVYLLCVSLHRQDRDDLLEAAIMHDCGKVDSTNIGNDRIYSYGHAQASLPTIDEFKEYLRYYELTRRISEKHMDYYEMGDPNIKNDLHMKEFVKADKKMSSVLFYEFFAEESSDNEKKQDNLFKSQRESSKVVYIAVGPSGSGKSTYLNKNFKKEVIVCPDEIRKELTKNISDQSKNKEVWEIAKERLLSTVSKFGEGVLDATNVDRYRRIQFMSAFNGTKKIALVFPVDLEESIRRVKVDIESGVDRSNVPEKVIERQHFSFEKGLSSLIHEFNEVRVVCESKDGTTSEIEEKINKILKEANKDE